ncbi:MAG: caspase family protein [Chitinophagaceae bacterium]
MRKALLVGINNYPDSPLSCCINDASVVGAILETNGDGSPNFEVHVETDVPTKSALRKMIANLFEGESDCALFFFSGHGYVNELGGFIITPDYKSYDEGVSMDEILVLAGKSEARNKIIILDCCYSGVFGTPAILGNGASLLHKGITILTACRDKEVAVEKGDHGIFSSLLIDALRGGAADVSGNITPGSLYAYIDNSLSWWKQRPVFKTNIIRFISLRRITPSVLPEVLKKIIEFFPTPEQEYKLNPSFEFTNTPATHQPLIEPFALDENVVKFKTLQKLQSVGLVVPVDAEHMYFAAMQSKSCRLTALGYHYWRLAKQKKI